MDGGHGGSGACVGSSTGIGHRGRRWPPRPLWRYVVPNLTDDAVTLIGLRKEPAQPLWERLYSDGKLAPGGRFVVPFGPAL